MSSKVQLIGGAFQDVSGNVLANGYLLMRLNQDAQANGASSISAGYTLRIILDQNGNVSTTPPQSVWPNDGLLPTGTFYFVEGYTASGELVWGPNSVAVTSTHNPFDVGVYWIPDDMGGSYSPVFPFVPIQEQCTGTVPGTVYTVPTAIYGNALIALFLNGGYLSPTTYTLSGQTVTLNFTTETGDVLDALHF